MTAADKIVETSTRPRFSAKTGNMSFQELCQNGSFLEKDFNGRIEGLIVEPDFYKNQLNHIQRIFLGILFFFISAVAVIGNGLSLLTTYKRKLQILYKCCVVSQSAGDLLMAAFVGINSLNNFIQDTIDWKFGGFMCSWMPYVTTMCALLSSMVITCIAIDRYQGTVLLAGKWDPKFTTAAFIVSCLWVVAAGATVPSFLSYNLKPACFVDSSAKKSSYAHLCLANKIINSQYYVTIFTFIFLPLLIAFLATYGGIARLILLKKKALKSQISDSASTIDTSVDSQGGQSSGGAPRVPSRAAKDNQEKKKVRTFTIILIIMATFIVCRLPQWIFLVVTSFPKYRFTGNVWWIVKYLLSAMSLANTAINPFIYPFLNDMVHLKSNLASGLKNFKNLKLKNIRMNLTSSNGK